MSCENPRANPAHALEIRCLSADDTGHRLYLNMEEREAFVRASEDFPREVRTFCLTLLDTGCGQTEALELTVDRVDVAAKILTFESLKKRKRGVCRSVPVPQSLLDAFT